MVTQKDYTAEAVNAARSVLIELVHLLGEYWENIVLIGGWVPEILLSRNENPHVGSIDVDLALNHLRLKEEGYKSIQDLLLSKGYEQGKQPFIFHREEGDVLQYFNNFRRTASALMRFYRSSMAFRFWRRIKIAPGVTLNLSKSGGSLSFGPRGAKFTVGSRGKRARPVLYFYVPFR